MNGSGPTGHGSPIRDHGEDTGRWRVHPRTKHDRGMARAAHLSKSLEATVRQIEGTKREGNKAKLTTTSIGAGMNLR